MAFPSTQYPLTLERIVSVKKHNLTPIRKTGSPILVRFPAATSSVDDTLRKFANGEGACSVDCMVFSDVGANRLYSRGYTKGWKREFAKHLLAERIDGVVVYYPPANVSDKLVTGPTGKQNWGSAMDTQIRTLKKRVAEAQANACPLAAK